MSSVVRSATYADIPFLESQSERIVKTPFTWSRHLSEEAESACFIAELEGQPVGHVLLGPSPAEANVTDPSGRLVSTRPVTWWKLLSLGVEAQARRQGLASILLAAAREVAPSTAGGIYGNIALTKTPDAAIWYRAKGFRVAVEGYIRDAYGRGTGWAVLGGMPDNMYFYAERGRLSHFATKTPTPEDEHKLAQREMDLLSSKDSDGLTAEFAYRAFGKALLERDPKRCVHLDERFGPQHGRMFAWDKDLVLSCRVCIEERLAVNRTNAGADREDFCDGCRRTARDVHLAKAIVDLHYVTAGLCGECRKRDSFAGL